VAKKVLIVDDDAATRNGLKALLEQSGYEVIVAGSFSEGRFALTESAPDLLISDIRLGEFNGLQLVATTTRAIPSIIVTGYPDAVLEAEARRLGAEYLVKPVVPAALMALIKRKLEPAGQTPVFSSARRWERKPVSGPMAARINDTPARILDISYGGLRFELQRCEDRPVPPSFRIDLPDAGVSVPVDLVWTARADHHWLCGAALSLRDEPATLAWHALVDTVS
jgi:DNA-binding response OmpR family regulator